MISITSERVSMRSKVRCFDSRKMNNEYKREMEQRWEWDVGLLHFEERPSLRKIAVFLPRGQHGTANGLLPTASLSSSDISSCPAWDPGKVLTIPRTNQQSIKFWMVIHSNETWNEWSESWWDVCGWDGVGYLVVVVVHLTTVLVELPLLAVNDATQRVLLPLESLDLVFVGVHHLYEVRLKR